MKHSTWIYIIIMVITTNLVRVIPLALIRTKIENRFIRSFLYYVPYVTLSVMTFPAIIHATGHPAAGCAALAIGIIAAWLGQNLLSVSLLCCVIVFVLELFLPV